MLAVGFLLPVIASTMTVFGVRKLHPATPRGHLFMLVYEAVGILFLFWVLRRQNRTFEELGVCLPMRAREIGHAVGLFFGALLVAMLVHPAIFTISAALGHPLHRTFNAVSVFGNQVTAFTILFVLVNPFHEELLVRAFLITEMEQFYQSTTLAIVTSVVLQSWYHLYQGVPAALVHASTFLIFSVYYVRRRSILPVVLAHLFMDVIGLVLYARHLVRQ